MKTNVKGSVLAFFLFVLVTTGYAQQNTSVAQLLQAKQWVMQGMTDKTSEKKYDKLKVFDYLNGKLFVTQDYYLSETPVTNFDSTKIGNTPNGKYIITRFKKFVNVYEIITITAEKLEIHSIDNPNAAKVLYIAKKE